MRVLVVESDPLFRRYLCRALEALGHDAEAVPNGARLLKAAADRAPDAVLSDFDPQDGALFGVCAALRRVRPQVRQVAITDDPDCAERARRSGMDGILLKPFGLSQLRGALSSF